MAVDPNTLTIIKLSDLPSISDLNGLYMPLVKPGVGNFMVSEALYRRSADSYTISQVDAAVAGANTYADNLDEATNERIDGLSGGILNANPTDTPVDGVDTYNANSAGTYTNFGGIVVAPEDFEGGIVQLRRTAGVWSKFVVEVPTAIDRINPLSAASINSEAVIDYVKDVADIPLPLEFTFLDGYYNTTRVYVASARHLSTDLLQLPVGTVISMRGFRKNVSTSSYLRWYNGTTVGATINTGTLDNYTFTVPPTATHITILVATTPLPEPADTSAWRATFQLVNGTVFETKIKLTTEDFFTLEPNIDIILDKSKAYREKNTISSTGTFLPAATNNLAFERVEVTPGAFISTSPLRNFIQLDASGVAISGTYINATSDFPVFRGNLNADTRYIMAAVPGNGSSSGLPPALETFRVVYGDIDNLTKAYYERLSTLEGEDIEVQYANTLTGTNDVYAASQDRRYFNDESRELADKIAEMQPVIDSLNNVTSATPTVNTITIPGKASEVNNHVQRIGLHYGSQRGDVLFDEVFLNGESKTDFSDIRFKDEEGNFLDFEIVAHGNYDIVKDSTNTYGQVNQFLSDGRVVSSQYSSAGNQVRISANGQPPWDILHGNVMLIFVDSRDNIFIFDESVYKMYKLKPSENYTIKNEVLDLSATSSDIRPFSAFCEDQNGYLYCGKYQDAFDAELFKSTDEGDTWVSIYQSFNNQHVHQISFDPYTNTLYAGIDGHRPTTPDLITRPRCVKSTDAGVTWTELPIPFYNRDYGLHFFGDGYRLGHGECSILGGQTIYRTTDDVNFVSVLNTNQGIRKIVEVDGVIYAGGNAGQSNRVAMIYASYDMGLTWKTIWAEDWQNTSGAGDALRTFSKVMIPAGGSAADRQMLIGGNGSYRRLRFFPSGSNYSAFAYVKVGNLPTSGRTITVETKYTYPAQQKKVFSEIDLPNKMLHLKLDENRGNYVADDVTNQVFNVNNVNWVASEQMRFGQTYPYKTRESLWDRAMVNTAGNVIQLPPAFKLPQKNFTVCFYANFSTIPIDANRKFLFGDPAGVHFYISSVTIWLTNGISSYGINAIDSIQGTDLQMFFALVVSNDTTPEFRIVVGDEQGLSTRVMTTWASVTGSDIVNLLGASGFQSLECPISDFRIYNRGLSDLEIREVFFGQSIL